MIILGGSGAVGQFAIQIAKVKYWWEIETRISRREAIFYPSLLCTICSMDNKIFTTIFYLGLD